MMRRTLALLVLLAMASLWIGCAGADNTNGTNANGAGPAATPPAKNTNVPGALSNTNVGANANHSNANGANTNANHNANASHNANAANTHNRNTE